MYTIDIDVGGTFTDGFFSNGAIARTAKVLTTPHDVAECFMNCILEGSKTFGSELPVFLRQTSVTRLSTTIGTNLLVQRSGPKLGMLVTRGFENTLYGKERAAILDQFIPTDMVLGVNEAIDDQGRVIQEVDGEDTLEAVRTLVQRGARMIVVSLRNAWRNPQNERSIREHVRRRYPIHYLRSVPLQLGTDVIHVGDDHARTNSVALNAYVHGHMSQALYRIEDQLRKAGYERPLLVIHASGGNARVAKTIALHTLNSGPAVAAHGAAYVARLLGLEKVVSTDMGGTSLDVALIVQGKTHLNRSPELDGVVVATPMIEVETLGAGGGSIGKLEGGSLQVGPESAGAAPGPVCYGKGGMEPTVTDANVLLGYIDPAYFLGGRMQLDVKAAARAMERRLGTKLGKSPVDAAYAIRENINQQMAEKIKKRILKFGHNPMDFTLFSVGGCAPLHSCAIAEACGISRVVMFPYGSVFSAFGGSSTNVQHLYSQTLNRAVENSSDIQSIIDGFRRQAERDMAGEGFAAKDIRVRVIAHVQVGGRLQVIEINAVEDLLNALSRRGEGHQVIESIQLTAECAVPHWAPEEDKPSSGAPAVKGSRTVRWRHDATPTPIYARSELHVGHTLSGPTIIEGVDTNYVIEPGWHAVVDKLGNFVLTHDGRR